MKPAANSNVLHGHWLHHEARAVDGSPLLNRHFYLADLDHNDRLCAPIANLIGRLRGALAALSEKPLLPHYARGAWTYAPRE
jgi:hypothetical protein